MCVYTLRVCLGETINRVIYCYDASIRIYSGSKNKMLLEY